MDKAQKTVNAIYSVYSSLHTMNNFSIVQMDALQEGMRAVGAEAGLLARIAELEADAATNKAET